MKKNQIYEIKVVVFVELCTSDSTIYDDDLLTFRICGENKIKALFSFMQRNLLNLCCVQHNCNVNNSNYRYWHIADVLWFELVDLISIEKVNIPMV